MRRIWIIWLLLTAELLLAGEPVLVFEDANKAYEQGRYSDAVEMYEDLLQSEGPRVGLLQNLGSAYFRNGDVGRAILSFERALLLKPGDGDIEANLKLAREEAAVFPADPGGSGGWLASTLSRRGWSWLVLTAALVFPLWVLAWFWKGRTPTASPLLKSWPLGLLIAFALIKTGLKAIDRRSGEDMMGIVVAKEADVKLSPFGTAEKRGTLSAGREVSLGERSKDYVWVEDGSGRLEGWMPMESVEPLVPRR